MEKRRAVHRMDNSFDYARGWTHGQMYKLITVCRFSKGRKRQKEKNKPRKKKKQTNRRAKQAKTTIKTEYLKQIS